MARIQETTKKTRSRQMKPYNVIAALSLQFKKNLRQSEQVFYTDLN